MLQSLIDLFTAYPTLIACALAVLGLMFPGEGGFDGDSGGDGGD
jgi:hypothetical protein